MSDTPEEYETAEAIVLSTAHITQDDGNQLTKIKEHGYASYHPKDQPAVLLCRGANSEGGWFYTRRQAEFAGLDDTELWSPQLVYVLDWAARNEFDYVLFDCDGPTIAALPTFRWE